MPCPFLCVRSDVEQGWDVEGKTLPATWEDGNGRSGSATFVLASDGDIKVDLGVSPSSLEAHRPAGGGETLGKCEGLLGPGGGPAGGEGEAGATAVHGGRSRHRLESQASTEDGREDPHFLSELISGCEH
jgi:hypothetical protein